MRHHTSYALVLVACFLFLSVPVAQAQNFPMPTKQGEPAATYEGKELYPYASPFIDHTGRFVDSITTRDYQQYPRTLRAKGASVVEPYNRVYMRIGEHFVGYDLSTFFTQELGKPLSSALINGGTRFDASEQYLPWLTHTYPEESNSGWYTYVLDGQSRLFDYAWDDRGYAYVAYSIWGFGVLDAENLDLVSQAEDAHAYSIESFEAGGKYYVITAGLRGDAGELWDVTDPTAPSKVRTLDDGVNDVRAASENTIAVVASFYSPEEQVTVTEFRIYRTQDLVSGQSPLFAQSPSSGQQFVAVDTDGTNYFALTSARTGYGSSLWQFRLDDATALSFSGEPTAFADFSARGLRYASDHLTVWGRHSARYDDVWLFELASGQPVKRELGDFLTGHYYGAISDEYFEPWMNTYTTIEEVLFVRHGGKEYLIVSAYGLGDVYELEPVEQPDEQADAGNPDPQPDASMPDASPSSDVDANSDTDTGPQPDAHVQPRDASDSSVAGGPGRVEGGCACSSTPQQLPSSALLVLVFFVSARCRRRSS